MVALGSGLSSGFLIPLGTVYYHEVALCWNLKNSVLIVILCTLRDFLYSFCNLYGAKIFLYCCCE